MPSSEDARKVVLRSRRDPAWFFREILGCELWSKQVEIVESVRDHARTMVRSCHGAGKTYDAAGIVLWFLSSWPGSVVATTAPTYRQVETILWQEIRRAHRRAKFPLGGEPLTTRLKLDDGWFAFGFSTNDPDAFQGLHADHVLLVFDEACGVPVDIWTAGEGALSGGHARLLGIGNPTDPATPFAEEFKTAGVSKIAISAFDTPNFTTFGVKLDQIRSGAWREMVPVREDGTYDWPMPGLVTPDWVADRHRRWGESSPLWLARVMGQFPDSAIDGLIPLSAVEAAQARELPEEGESELGVDVARFGDDETTIYKRRGGRVRLHAAYSQQDTMETTGCVAKAIRDTHARTAKVDVVGIGAGVVDRLSEQKLPVVAVNVGERASDPERFANRRAEVFWELRERFVDTGDIDIDPEDDELAEQLVALKYKVDSKGRIVIESKDEMRRRGLKSPDRADGIALAFAQPIQRGVSFSDLYGEEGALVSA